MRELRNPQAENADKLSYWLVFYLLLPAQWSGPEKPIRYAGSVSRACLAVQRFVKRIYSHNAAGDLDIGTDRQIVKPAAFVMWIGGLVAAERRTIADALRANMGRSWCSRDVAHLTRLNAVRIPDIEQNLLSSRDQKATC
ncbi:hypothetical protein CHU98_g2076 [Xylaria longipes]|nr:hypothetical protein CHU98_g2076 [Xylaria longipes]